MEIHKEVYDKLDFFYNQNNIPNIIFHGSSGCGKKTILVNFINKIYNHDIKKIKNNVMFVNCSHGKGIKFIREDLKMFAKMNLQFNSKFKSIVLLNAENLTNDAQSALRRCIEQFAYNTRFFVVVEKKDNLLNPIISRFCDIYIPEYIENNNVVNLHTKFKSNINVDQQNETKHTYFSKLFTSIHKNHGILLDVCESIYNNGYSCYDMIKYIENADDFTGKKHGCIFEFNRVKQNIKNEKLLLLYMLNYIYHN